MTGIIFRKKHQPCFYVVEKALFTEYKMDKGVGKNMSAEGDILLSLRYFFSIQIMRFL